MEAKTQNALERFIEKTRELFAKEPDLDKRWTMLSPILAELIADPEVREASKSWPDCVPADGRAENLLFYEDPDYGFAINGLTKGAARQGGRARIHDHAHIYTLYGVLDGRERIERYERVDDRSRPGHAEIKKSSDRLVGPGEIDLVRPHEIHTEVTVGERTVAVIVRSQKGGGFNQGRYNPEKNEYYESLGRAKRPSRCWPKDKSIHQAAAGDVERLAMNRRASPLTIKSPHPYPLPLGEGEGEGIGLRCKLIAYC